MTTWKDHKQALLKDEEFRRAYEALEPEYRLARQLIDARLESNLTQQEVAQKAGVSRSVVARLESGVTNPTFTTVSRVAQALGRKVQII